MKTIGHHACLVISVVWLSVCPSAVGARAAPLTIAKVDEWARLEPAKAIQLMADQEFASVLKNPSPHATVLLQCFSAYLPAPNRREMCLFLLQRAPLELFVNGYRQLAVAYESKSMSTLELVEILGRSTSLMNRFSLLHARADVSQILESLKRTAELRTHETGVAELLELITKYQNGRRRLDAIERLNSDPTIELSPFLASPSTEDEASLVRRALEMIAVNILAIAAFGLGLLIVITILRRRYWPTGAPSLKIRKYINIKINGSD